MAYRRYLTEKGKFGPKFKRHIDGGNPFRNSMRFVCRKCLYDQHLLRDCPQLTPAKRVHLVNSILRVETIAPDSLEYGACLDEAQEFDDLEWKVLCSKTDYSPLSEENTVNFITYNVVYKDLANCSSNQEICPNSILTTQKNLEWK